MLSDWLPFFKKTLWCQAHGCRLNQCMSPDAQCIVTSDFMPCPDGENTNFIVSAELRNPDGIAPVHAFFVVPGLLADQGWESYYPFLIPRALPMFPLGVYCVYLKSVNRDAFPFIAIVDDLLREQHLKDTTPNNIHQMTHSLTDTGTNTSLEACATPTNHSQAAGGISTPSPRSFSLLPSTTIATNDYNSSNDSLNAPNLEKAPGVQTSNTNIEYIDPAVTCHRASTMPTTMQAVQSGQPPTVTASKTWAGVAADPGQVSAKPPKVEMSAKNGTSIKTDEDVPFQRQLNGNQLRKARRQHKTGAEPNAKEEIPAVLVVENDSKKVQCHQNSTSAVQDQSGTSKTGQGHKPNPALSIVGTSMTEPKEARVDKGLDTRWPALSNSKSPPKDLGRTNGVKLPGTGIDDYEEPAECSSPQAAVQVESGLQESSSPSSLHVEHERPQSSTPILEQVDHEPLQVHSPEVKPSSSAQSSLLVEHQQPEPSTPILEQVDHEPLQVHSAQVKPKTKGQKKNERRRNAKKATKAKEEEEAAALSSATASALAESIASMAKTEIETKPETIKEPGQRKKNPNISKSAKPANVISKSALLAKANPSAEKPVPVKAKSARVFGSVPSSSFEPVLSEQPQELKWDVPPEQTPINGHHFELPVFAESNNILPTDDTEQEIGEPLIESMSTAPTPHSGLFDIPSEMKDWNQSVPKQGLFNFSSPSINLGPPTTKEGPVSSLTECNGLDIPTPTQGLASLTPTLEGLDQFDQPSNVSLTNGSVVYLEDIPDMTPENIAKLISELREVLSEEIPASDTSEAIAQNLSGGIPDAVPEVNLERALVVFEDPDQLILARMIEWLEVLIISTLANWLFYGYVARTPDFGPAGPFSIVQIVAYHRDSQLSYELCWEVPLLWGGPKPSHLQSPPTPRQFVGFGREIFEIFDEEQDVSQMSDAGTKTETSEVTIKSDIAGEDSSSVTETSRMMSEDLKSEDQIPDPVTVIPQPSSVESRSSLVEAHHNMDHSMPAVPQEYNIRENVYFFLPPEDEVPNTVENTDDSRASTTESGSTPVEEKHNATEAGPSVPPNYPQTYNIRENVYFFLPPEDDVSDTVENTENSRVSITESRSTLVDENHNANEAGPSMPPEDDVTDAIGNTDVLPPVPQNLNTQENVSLPEEESKIQENVSQPEEEYDIMKNEDAEVSKTVAKSDSDHPVDVVCSERGSRDESNNMDDGVLPVSKDLNSQENAVLPEEGYDIMKNVYFFIPKEVEVSDTVMKSNSDQPINGTDSERESCGQEIPNMDTTIPPPSKDLKNQGNAVLPEEGYDIMKNVYFFMSKEDNVSDRAMESNSGHRNDGASFERESREKENTIGACVEESPESSPNEMASPSGTVVISPSNLEGQEQLRTAVWAARNAPYKVSHSRNVSSATTGTSSSLDEMMSMPSVTSLGTAEGEIGLAENSANSGLIPADEENLASTAPVQNSPEESSQQNEEIHNFVYNFGTATVRAGKQGFEVGKAAAIVMLIPADLALKATVSSFKATKTSFLIGRWACARFGPRWLGRLIGA